MDIITLSQYVVCQFSQQSSGGITPMKLQKLLYYIKVWTLVAKHDLVRADFEHWDYGPVNREVYNFYKQYQSFAIDPNQIEDVNIRQQEKYLVDFIVENYIGFDAFALSAMTHTEEPWKQTQGNNIILDELIKSYYCQQSFAKNFQPFDLSSNPFYPLDNYSFVIDMTEKNAREITRYPTYESYKLALRDAKQSFEEKWLSLGLS
jgi:uncharacterized phage-associated protein